jgi:hypothetical protein
MNLEHALRVMRQPIACSIVHESTAVAIAVASRNAGESAPDYVHAGVPFIVRDAYAAQLCISARSGRPLPPFVTCVDAQGSGDGLQRVDAGIPFRVNDGSGTTLCVSSRGGQALAPFIVP